MLLKWIGAEARWKILKDMKTSPIVNHGWALCDCNEFDGTAIEANKFSVPSSWQAKFHAKGLEGLSDCDFE